MSDFALDMKDIDVVLFDLDGTVYYGPNIIPGANETIAFFRDHGVRVFFATNNSTKTRAQIHQRLINMGVDCSVEEVLTSGYLAARYAKQHKLEKLYIFGSPNLIDEFESQGVHVEQSEDAENLLIGYDPEMTYAGLTEAVRVAMKAKCVMACNKERVYPGKDAKLMPGCGAMTAPVEWCARRECDVIIGKPNTLMADLIAAECDVNKARILMVGDTYDSDVRMALRAGCKAIHIAAKVLDDCVPTVATIADIPAIVEPIKLQTLENLEFKRLEGEWEVRPVWEALGSTYMVPLAEQVDFDAYVSKMAENGITVAGYLQGDLACAATFYVNDQHSKTAFITQLAVAPKLRLNGIGRILLNHIIGVARKAGMEHIRVEADDRASAARPFLEACGFQVELENKASVYLIKAL